MIDIKNNEIKIFDTFERFKKGIFKTATQAESNKIKANEFAYKLIQPHLSTIEDEIINSILSEAELIKAEAVYIDQNTIIFYKHIDSERIEEPIVNFDSTHGSVVLTDHTASVEFNHIISYNSKNRGTYYQIDNEWEFTDHSAICVERNFKLGYASTSSRIPSIVNEDVFNVKDIEYLDKTLEFIDAIKHTNWSLEFVRVLYNSNKYRWVGREDFTNRLVKLHSDIVSLRKQNNKK